MFVGVNTGDQRDAAIKFARSRGLGYPAVFDGEGKVADAYGVETLPTLVVINRVGHIIFVRHGVVRPKQLEQLVLQATEL